MTVHDAYKLLPADAAWSCSFGNPGEGGFTEYYRTPTGDRWIVSNGPQFFSPSEFDWNCVKG